jgi:hypothetical protein
MNVRNASRLAASCAVGFVASAMCASAQAPTIRFTDATQSAGIRFRHESGARGRFHLPETIGSGGAFFDFDRDGDLDLYLLNGVDFDNPGTGPGSALYENNGDGTFTDITARAGIANVGNYGMGCAVGDVDNDGDSDLYVTNFGADVLYRNNGDGTFSDVTREARLGDPSWGSSATFLDYDGDDYLDLYVVNYVEYALSSRYPPCITDGLRTYCHPRHFSGAPDRLYRNNGDGTFVDVTQKAGIVDAGGEHEGKGLGVVAADFDNDGDTDVYVANDDTPNYLFLNRGDGTFEERATLAGCAYSVDGIAQAGMGVTAGDYNDDGWLDIFVTNLVYETNACYRNNGDGTFTDVTYDASLGNESYLFVGFGTGFLDVDNDGRLDLFVANGHILNNVEQMTDAITYAQRNQLFWNVGDGTFAELADESSDFLRRLRVSRGAIFGDYDNDGDTDIVVTNSGQPVELWRNDTVTGNHWLRVRVVGTKTNRDGYGTRLTLTANAVAQMREVHAGSSYLSSNDPRVLFGLGANESAERLVIRWQSGVTQTFDNVSADREITVLEPSATSP